MQAQGNNRKYLWMDLEMSGLDPEHCHILEISALITDLQFQTLDEYECVVFQKPEILEAMDDWCTKTHAESGLSQKVPHGIPLSEAEKNLIQLLDRNFDAKEKVVLCGNSIGQDRKFIDRYLPNFASKLHYRMVDVSSFKEIFRDLYKIQFEKKNSHRAKDDILESIAELKHYLQYVDPKKI